MQRKQIILNNLEHALDDLRGVIAEFDSNNAGEAQELLYEVIAVLESISEVME